MDSPLANNYIQACPNDSSQDIKNFAKGFGRTAPCNTALYPANTQKIVMRLYYMVYVWFFSLWAADAAFFYGLFVTIAQAALLFNAEVQCKKRDFFLKAC